MTLWAGCTGPVSEDRAAQVLARPEVSVRGLSSTGFTLVWDVVENADSYTYEFNGEPAVTTEDRSLAFSGLEKHTEYVISVKADAAEGSPYRSSEFTYVHVFTDDLVHLDTPELILGSAYASKTIISWSMVSGAAGYEYTINGRTTETEETQAIISGLEPGKEYTFTLKAISADPQNALDSEPAVLSFTTEEGDLPRFLIVPTSVVADAVSFDVYAEAGNLYYHDVVPGYLLARYTEEELMETYRTAILQYAEEQGISLSLALSAVLTSGTRSFTVTGLVSEMTYAVVAFGMDTKGELTSNLYVKEVKTTATGASDGPDFGGSDWFSQRFYLDNTISALSGEDWTTSAVTYWEGMDVEDMRYRVLPTDDFNTLFSDPPDQELLKSFLKDENYAYVASQGILAAINSVGITMLSSGLSPGISYTLSSLAVSDGGEELLSVNSLTTKSDPTARTWFQVSTLVDEQYGDTWNSAVAVMRGVEVTSLKYMMIASSALEKVPVSSYPDLLEDYGNEGTEEHLSGVNGGGLAIRFVNLSPSTEYTFIAMAGNPTGDTLLRYSGVSTTAAPEGERSVSAMSVKGPAAAEGGIIKVDPADKDIFSVQSIFVPAREKTGTEDLWTIIHNMKILERE